jgi:glycine/D-amino acid oxidase-like deaminating enzyme
MSKNSDVLIVGAGLAGLNAAIQLQKAGRSVTVIESSDRAGGRVASDHIDGFICDRGFQLINSKYPALVALDVIDEIDFIAAPRTIEVSLGIERIVLGDPRSAPFSALHRGTGSLNEKVNFARFIFTKIKGEQSLGQALRKAGCGTTYERVLKPFLQGVFLADPELVDAAYGQIVIRSFVTGSPGIPRYGVGQLSQALASRIADLQLNVRAERIVGNTVQTSAGDFQARDILIATDATTATQLLEQSEVCRMQGCVTWYHASGENPSGTGRLVIDGQNRGPVMNSLVISDISKAYAPSSMNLISSTTELGTTDSEVRRHLSTMWGVQTRDWQLIAKYEIPSALPLHNVGKVLTQPTKISEHLYVAGDHRTVPSQQGALFSGNLAAQLILN